jgi:hypothetical protein
MNAIQAEVDRNFDAFLRVIGRYLPKEEGRYAVMRHGKIVEFHDSVGNAVKAGAEAFPDQLYSVQEATTRPVDLGFFSHAFNHR